ncbi:MAG: VWA domain-containing protein [Clostridiales bacterium]|nr:VWA domain-containing protein [Clostridiales bacterium]
MSLLAPLGLIGLISLGVLILIYLLKPNYQRKLISSTFVWKLSLKYRKKKLPINYLRDILILICQILIFTACAMILARPVITSDSAKLRAEKIIIIDASVSMRTMDGDKSRFQRAVDKTIDLALSSLSDDGVVSVIVATDNPYFVVQRADSSAKRTVLEDLNAISESNEKCSYTKANMEKAMALAENVLLENQEAGVLLVTGTEYIDTGIVEVIDVSNVNSEWNAAILDCQAELIDGFYNFNVDVACYNKNDRIVVYLDVYDVNGTTDTFKYQQTVYCSGDKTVPITFKSGERDAGAGVPILSFSSANVYIKEKDNYDLDNTFAVYGGRKEKIRIQYVSSKTSVFLNSILMSLREELRHKWDIELVKAQYNESSSEEDIDKIALTGFDLYVFENVTPEMMPNDGLVLLVNPGYSIAEIGYEYMGYTYQETLEVGFPHPVNKGIDQSSIEKAIINVGNISNVPAGFDVVLQYSSKDPAVMVKNTSTEKIAIINLGFAYTDISALVEFPIVIYNIFDYFIPSTISGYSFNIGDTVSLRSRGETLSLMTPREKIVYNTFPAQYTIDIPGKFTLEQVPFARAEEDKIIENFFVRVDKEESNIFRRVDELVNPYVAKKPEPIDLDLLIYFISVAVGLLFVEWILKSKES